ncbi:hypothetical protein KC19_12G110300 [Ceratodon purpureus]|uniref:Uncharacterized protein n=1 Tax=Ceratodon purpureus TaxID=3225 RepID=A0A8T0G8M0_CERPU|nr:hypothetical protein KC19_12G110300 [Ceratodon purpureus]
MRLLLYCTSAGHLGITRRSSTTSVLSSGHLSSPNDALQPKLRAPSSEHHLFLTQTQPTHAHHHPEINLHLRDLHSVTSPSSSLLMPRAYADNFKWKGPAPEFDQLFDHHVFDASEMPLRSLTQLQPLEKHPIFRVVEDIMWTSQKHSVFVLQQLKAFVGP